MKTKMKYKFDIFMSIIFFIAAFTITDAVISSVSVLFAFMLALQRDLKIQIDDKAEKIIDKLKEK